MKSVLKKFESQQCKPVILFNLYILFKIPAFVVQGFRLQTFI